METPLEILKAFYEKVDRMAQTLEALNKDRLHCRAGCADCCLDGITVFEVESDYIRQTAPEILNQQPHPKGKCAFLDENNLCRIYPFRPYVCRTQGLPLRWFEYNESGIKVEYRDICPLNEQGPDIRFLEDRYFWEIGPFEQELADMQQKYKNGRMKRIQLRELFYSDHAV